MKTSARGKGTVEKGDYILAGADGYAVAKKAKDISGFEEYKKVIGTAWEGKGYEGNGRILVAVGVK